MAEFGDDSDDYESHASQRPSFAPTVLPARPSLASTAPAPHTRRKADHDSEGPASSEFDGEDFLFHLYRGSELLQDNCVAEAKEELELALRVQPQDVEGQGLLGVVYFRLGLYPRAIEIYQQISRVRPGEISPRVNLALCFLKTGQSQAAREVLEEVTARAPDHVRAWGYLGLVYERLAEYERAKSAFESAGQPHLVRRMQQLIDQLGAAARDSDNRPERAEVRAAAADAVQELETEEPGFSRVGAEPERNTAPVGRWRAIEPGEDPRPRAVPRRASLPGRFGPAVPVIPEPVELPRASVVPFSRVQSPPGLAPELLVAQPPGADSILGPDRRSALLDVRESWAARSDAVRGLLAERTAFSHLPLTRRMRGRESVEPLGGPGSPWLLLRGSGQILLGAAPERELSALELEGSFIYVRESALVGFAGTLHYENGRLPTASGEPVPMVQITGHGTVLIESRKPPRVMTVTENQKLAVRADDVLGWLGRLLGQPLDLESAPLRTPGFVGFSGSGSVLIDLG